MHIGLLRQACGRPAPMTPWSLYTPFGESKSYRHKERNRQLRPNEYLWCERTLNFPEEELIQNIRKRCLLHFGAADQKAVVYVNGYELLRHTGG